MAPHSTAGRDDADPPLDRVLVVGMGVTGRAVTAALRRRGSVVVAVDDRPSEEMEAALGALDVALVGAPSADELDGLVAGVDAVLPTPGLPDRHPVFASVGRHGVPVLSELDLARRWDDRPIAAVTGTDGKTTVTTMVTAMLVASGRRAVACGNTEVPLVAALDDAATEVFVVEASSFRLGHTRRFLPAVATWLNFAPDHLDVHESLARYEASKARIWADLDARTGVAIANADDPVVMADRNPLARTLTFGLGGPGTADATVVDGLLTLPGGIPLVRADELTRSLPHDVANALAAAVTAREAGADLEGIRHVLRTHRAPAHRVELVAETDGVRWYDDSKATTPHATLAAVSGFPSVVLLAGGRNKGLDLAGLGAAVPPVRAVVAIGEAGAEVEAVFAGRCEVRVVPSSMDDAVAEAARLALPGDAVLLSPACTSFDWYRSYAERGDDFARLVRALPDAEVSR